MSRLRPYHALAAIPTLAILVGVPLVNRVHRSVFGLPFLLFWMVACVLLTSALMAIIVVLDRLGDAKRSSDPGPGEARHRTGASRRDQGSAR